MYSNFELSKFRRYNKIIQCIWMILLSFCSYHFYSTTRRENTFKLKYLKVVHDRRGRQTQMLLARAHVTEAASAQIYVVHLG